MLALYSNIKYVPGTGYPQVKLSADAAKTQVEIVVEQSDDPYVCLAMYTDLLSLYIVIYMCVYECLTMYTCDCFRWGTKRYAAYIGQTSSAIPVVQGGSAMQCIRIR